MFRTFTALILLLSAITPEAWADGPLPIVDDATGRVLAHAMIWEPSAPDNADPYFVAFRKQFAAAEAPRAAALHIFADVRYLLWINGQYAGRGPARFDPKGPEYDTLDIGNLVKPGDNTLAVVVMGNASNGKMMRHVPGLTLQLDLTSPDGKHQRVQTDNTWRCSDQTRYRKPVVSWGNLQDRLDATVEDGDWTQEVYDDKTWKNAVSVEGAQWGMLSARRTPLLRDTPVAVKFAQPFPVTLTAGQQMTLDAGRMVQAYSVIDVEADAGTVINLAYAGVTYKARAGRQRFMTSDTFAFQTGAIRVQSGRAIVRDVQIVERLYPFDCVGSFHSNDPMLDQLWRVCVRSCQLLSEDAYEDCADRERVEWMDEDPPAFDVTRVALAGPGPGGTQLFADGRLLGAMLRRTALSQQPNGWVKAHTSSDRFDIHAKMEDRACDWVQGARRYYESTGDKAVIREIWPAVVKQMDWFLALRTARGLVNAREWVIWGNPVAYQTLEGAGLNAFVYRALADAAYLGDAIGEARDARRFNAAAAELKTAFNATLWDDKDGTYYSGFWGVNAKSGEANRPLGLKQTSGLVEPTMFPALFALDQGIVPAERIQPVTTYLLAHRGEPKRMMAWYYLFKQLYAQHQAALDQEVLDSLRKNWKAMSEGPWQTTWEEFSGGSKAHVYGMFPAYFLSAYVLGVRIDGPVWDKRLLIEPRLADLTLAEGKVATEFGPVDVSWRRAEGELAFTCTIPAGATARLRLPGAGRLDGQVFDGSETTLSPGRHEGAVNVRP